ncbi:MAG: NAD(P)-dependent oxidoreductase [Candidatus Nanopelagicales bacterium]
MARSAAPTARLAQGLGMTVIAFDAMLRRRHAGCSRKPASDACGLQELIRQADVVTLHVPLVDGTRGLFDAQRIASMKPGAILINTSRGHIVDLHGRGRRRCAAVIWAAQRSTCSTYRAAACQTPHCRTAPDLLLTPAHLRASAQSPTSGSRSLIADKVLEALH